MVYDVHITKLKLHNRRAKINKPLQKMMLGAKKERAANITTCWTLRRVKKASGK